jgi:hypothetical protein
MRSPVARGDHALGDSAQRVLRAGGHNKAHGLGDALKKLGMLCGEREREWDGEKGRGGKEVSALRVSQTFSPSCSESLTTLGELHSHTLAHRKAGAAGQRSSSRARNDKERRREVWFFARAERHIFSKL